MEKNTKVTKRQTVRSQIKNLPKPEKNLGKDELRHIKGGGGMMKLLSGNLKQE